MTLEKFLSLHVQIGANVLITQYGFVVYNGGMDINVYLELTENYGDYNIKDFWLNKTGTMFITLS